MSDSNRDTIEQPLPLPRSRSLRVWLLVALGVALFLAVPTFLAIRWFSAASGPAAPAPAEVPSVVASYRADFLPEHPKTGWHYYWNANGPPGDTNGYVPLVWNGTLYVTAEAPLPAPSPARYLRVSATGGHPGQGPSQTGSRGVHYEHAAIVAFTVSDAGSYVIGHSFISRHAGPKSGSVHLQVFVGERDIGAEVFCRSREGVSFDRQLGRLAAGDSIYVVIGADETDLDDSFDLDFTIGRL